MQAVAEGSGGHFLLGTVVQPLERDFRSGVWVWTPWLGQAGTQYPWPPVPPAWEALICSLAHCTVMGTFRESGPLMSFPHTCYGWALPMWAHVQLWSPQTWPVGVVWGQLLCLLNCWTCVQRLMEQVKPAEDIVLACMPWQVRKGRASLRTALSGSTCQDLRKKGPHNTYHTPTELRNEKPEKKKKIPEALPPSSPQQGRTVSWLHSQLHTISSSVFYFIANVSNYCF